MNNDYEIYENVLEKLKFEPYLDHSKIVVSVQDGVVTLAGKVETYIERSLAEKAVRKVAGVRGVAEEITVSLNERECRSDSEIAKAALAAISWNVLLPAENIQVVVEKGRVTLLGEVENYFQKKYAKRTLAFLRGVTGINNHLKIKPRVIANDIKAEIIKEFQRNAMVKAEKIQVETKGGKVILKGGPVQTWSEIKEAKRAAWSVPGVTEVEATFDF